MERRSAAHFIAYNDTSPSPTAATGSIAPTTTSTPSISAIPDNSTWHLQFDPMAAMLVRVILPAALVAMLLLGCVITRCKARAKVIAVDNNGRALDPEISTEGGMRIDLFSPPRTPERIRIAMSTPFYNVKQWVRDQEKLGTEQNKWGAGHGVVSLVPGTFSNEAGSMGSLERPEMARVETERSVVGEQEMPETTARDPNLSVVVRTATLPPGELVSSTRVTAPRLPTYHPMDPASAIGR